MGAAGCGGEKWKGGLDGGLVRWGVVVCGQTAFDGTDGIGVVVGHVLSVIV